MLHIIIFFPKKAQVSEKMRIFVGKF